MEDAERTLSTDEPSAQADKSQSEASGKKPGTLSFRALLTNLSRQARSRQARQAGVAFMIIVAGAGVGVLSQILVARLAGAAAYGVYAFVLTWLQILALLPRLGMDNGLLRYLAAYTATKKWGLAKGITKQAIGIVVGASVVVSTVWGGVVFLLRGQMASDVAIAMWIACLGLPFMALVIVGGGALRGLKKIFQALFPHILLRRALFGGFAGLLYLLGRRGISGAEIVAYDVAAITIGALLSLFWLRRAIPPESRRARPRYATRLWLRTTIPMGIGGALGFVVNRLDIVLIGLLLTADSTGIYAAAVRIAALAVFGLKAVNTIAAPLISQHYATGNIEALQRTVTKACRMALAVTLAFALVVLIAPEAILGLFGEEFKGAATVLVILFIGQIVNAMTGPVGYTLNMTTYEKESMLINAINLVVALIALPVAIHFGGIVGAAIVTASLIAALNILRWIVVYRKLGIRSWVFG